MIQQENVLGSLPILLKDFPRIHVHMLSADSPRTTLEPVRISFNGTTGELTISNITTAVSAGLATRHAYEVFIVYQFRVYRA